MAALLFKVDYAWQNGLTSGRQVACTSKENKWISPVLKSDVEPVRASDMVIEKPHYLPKKRPVGKSHAAKKDFRVAPLVEPSLDKLTAALYNSCPSAVAFNYSLSERSPSYCPGSDVNVAHEMEVETSASVPVSLQQLSAAYPNAEEFCANLPTYSGAQVEALQDATKEQSESSQWKEQRRARITASLAHRVHRKTAALRQDRDAQTASLVRSILGEGGPAPDLPALKYGRQTEPVAVEVYQNQQQSYHTELTISTCGLFVLPDAVFIGASPDRLVSCKCCGNGLLEVKCPLSMAGKPASQMKYLIEVDGVFMLNRNHEYYAQVQYQMGVTGRQWCDFFVYTKNPEPFTERIHFNEDYCKELFASSKFFFTNYVSKALFEMHKAT